MLNRNLEKAYKPYECITIQVQLFSFRGHSKFTQYIPRKPATYGIFWACDASNAYPLQGQIYTEKPIDGLQQVNVGERTVLNLVSLYKSSGRNVTTDNFSTTMELAKVLFSLYSQKKQKTSAKQHAAYQGKACLFNQFRLPS